MTESAPMVSNITSAVNLILSMQVGRVLHFSKIGYIWFGNFFLWLPAYKMPVIFLHVRLTRAEALQISNKWPQFTARIQQNVVCDGPAHA